MTTKQFVTSSIWFWVWVCCGGFALTHAQVAPPDLDDFWAGRAEWVLDVADVGLPIGESDTIIRNNGEMWSYLHASYQSAGVVDQCGEPVAFPGCMTRWTSTDNGQSFALTTPVCMMSCQQCPCDDGRDHITAQQYPRVAITPDTQYLVYEWHAQTVIRTSQDGLNWSNWQNIVTPAGTYPYSYAPCLPSEQIGTHPNIRGQADGCLVGAPPGIYIEGDTIYVFVTTGSAPSSIRCYKGNRHGNLSQLQVCDQDPLFSGALSYGDTALLGAEANAYFDFRYVSSAEIVQTDERYYLFYEGIRGPDVLERGMDTQFALGLARSIDGRIDGVWEKYSANPLLRDMGFWVGIGHADLLIIDGVTYLYTQTSETTRGRYQLAWRKP
jgi:hypothetical protein